MARGMNLVIVVILLAAANVVVAGVGYSQNGKKEGTYIGTVVTPGPVFDKSGKMVGYTDSLGKTYVSGKANASSRGYCTLPSTVRTVMEGGLLKYGIDPNGNLVDACGNRIKHTDTISCKSVTVTVGKTKETAKQVRTDKCVDESQSLKSYDTLKAAVAAAAKELNGGECKISYGEGHGLEAGYGIYKQHGKYYYGYKSWYSNSEASVEMAPGAMSDVGNGYELVATIHNHPDPESGHISQWFSDKDWASARQRGVCMYMIACAEGGGNGSNPRLLRLNPQTGEVDEIDFATGEKIAGPLTPSVEGFVDFRKLVANESNATAREIRDQATVVVKKALGVLGWCKCKDDPERRGAKAVVVGMDATFSENPIPGYVYKFCLCCGKCRRPSKVDEIIIYDRELEVRLQKATHMKTHEYEAARVAVQAKLIKIPDGQIVIPGKCSCKTPDPINSGYQPDESVCAICGMYCEDRRIGPTAMRIAEERVWR